MIPSGFYCIIWPVIRLIMCGKMRRHESNMLSMAYEAIEIPFLHSAFYYKMIINKDQGKHNVFI